ncbi:MAG: HlyD family efflux transporter periplasmic adaptor subunit [Pseudomonadales bacterium]|nr:HlyD family efflux transporter periplasmic adaptor subunit [Pseudomonadales bacterium]
MFSRRSFIFSLLAIAVGFALFSGLRPAPVLVDTEQVKTGVFRATIDEEGVTRVKDRYRISAPVSGYLRRVDLDVGDRVIKNQLLTELEPLRSDVLDPRRRAEAEARVSAARAALQSAEEKTAAAKADAELADEELARKEQLRSSRSISEDELTRARKEQQRTAAVLRSANFAVDVARYELEASSTLLQYSAAQDSSTVLKERVAILSPVDGSVLKLYQESEGVVQAGEPLLEVGNPTALEVAVDVLSFDAVKITPGMQVRFDRWGGEPLSGTVRLIEPVGFTRLSALGVEEQRVWVIVDITSPSSEWQRLGDGYRVEASFMLAEQHAVLLVPDAALFHHDNGWAVYRVKDHRAERVRVMPGNRNGLQAVILDGLEEGDEIIVHPGETLKEGTSVKVRE